jgi:transposase
MIVQDRQESRPFRSQTEEEKLPLDNNSKKDLEKHRTIELLPDREEETLTAWLHTHPEIEVISRDRGGEYAAAAKKGAPQAQQIADKFHLVKNLREGLKELMARKQKVLPEVEEVASDGIPLCAQGQH